jgi:hypothetical protein
LNKASPAMAVGHPDRLWDIADIVNLIESLKKQAL